jgi:N-acyl-D-aspartate/D-glutamate deacylase
MFDLIIRNGQIVDGTGQKMRHGDVAVENAVISAVGDVPQDAKAKRVIDAEGCMVTPGWVDAHTHFDGQASWDPTLTPSSNQGTTTVVMGNCGVGFAPCKPDEHDMLISIMEDVEDIPGSALAEGISWDWESYPEYLDALEKLPHSIDVGSQIPHCAVRCYVMGERALRNEEATDEDIKKMTTIVRDGLRHGAIGFTTSRTKLHVTKAGDAVPGTYASEKELLGIAKALGEMGGVYGLVSDFDSWEKEMDWMKRLSVENKCPVNFVLFYRGKDGFERAQKQIRYAREAVSEGANLIPHISTRPVNILMGFHGTVNPFMFCENFGALGGLSPEERYKRLSDPELRAKILAEPAVAPETGIEGTQDMLNDIVSNYDRMYVLGDPPNYEPTADQSIAAVARRENKDPRAVAYDTMLRNHGKELLYFPNFSYETGDFSCIIEMMKEPNSIFSLADSGAHCGVLCDATAPSHILAYHVRDRKRGERLNLEWAVASLTRDTARCVGLHDRGTLEVGMKADINIIDFDKLQLKTPEVVFDLPADGRRIMQEVEGYKATIVSGVPIFENGVDTGMRPGKLIRRNLIPENTASAKAA